jgi:hypothetical protein
MLFFIQYLALPPAHWMHDCLYAQGHLWPGADKPFSCLEVEPAEDARPEVQATTIEVRVPPPGDESQCGKIDFFTVVELSRPVWSGHSCPPLLTLILGFDSTKTKGNFKGGGQECPPHILT